MAQGVMQSLIKVSANFASENMYRDMYRGMAASQKMGKAMGQSYTKAFNNEVKQPIGGVGYSTSSRSTKNKFSISSSDIILTMTKIVQNLADRDSMYRETAISLGGEDPLKTFNNILRDPLENAAYEYATSIEELNNYVLEAIKSGFDPKNIASSLNSVAGLKRAHGLSVPAITELIVMANNNGWIDPSDGKSINEYLVQLITMEQNNKGSLRNFSNSLDYSQPILNAPEMTSTDYITLMSVLSDSNIKETREGRAMGHFLQRLFVPNSNADEIDTTFINALKKDGYNVNTKDLKGLSEYLDSIKWSIYNEEGQIQIGEGKRYTNYVDAVTNLMEKIENSDFSNAMTKGMGGEFGQLAQRFFEHLLANYPKLKDHEIQLIKAKENPNSMIKSKIDISTSGLGYARDKFNSSLERLALAALGLEESFGVLEGGLKNITWILEKVGDGMNAGKDFKDDIDNETDYTKRVLAIKSIARDNNINLSKPITKAQEEFLIKASYNKVAEEIKRRKTDPSYFDKDLKTAGLGTRVLKGSGTIEAMELLEQSAKQDPEKYGSTIKYIEKIDTQQAREKDYEIAALRGTNFITPLGMNNNMPIIPMPNFITSTNDEQIPLINPIFPPLDLKKFTNTINITVNDATEKGTVIEVDDTTVPTHETINEED